MQSRETRFVLRIESGDRQGEQVPLAEGTLQVGRKPECGLMLKDASVSGKHAELRVAGTKIELVDLGSTNGTRLGGEKVTQAWVSPGDAILFGNIRVSLHDAGAAGGGTPSSLLEPPIETPSGVPDSSGALGHVSAEKVTRSRTASKRPLVAVLVLVVLGGGAFAALKFLRPGGTTRARPVIPAVPGNLLADGSFEEGKGEWTAAETAPVAFSRERGFAATGDLGLGATLEDSGNREEPNWSLARSAEVSLHARRSLVFAGSLRIDDGAFGRVGVELASSTRALPSFLAWMPARPASGSFEPFELGFDIPSGYDRGRLVVAGVGAGAVALDDISVLEKEALGGAARFTEYELAVLGKPGSSAVLVRSGTPLLTGFDLSTWNRGRPEGWAQAKLEAQAGPRGFRLAFPGAPAGASLRFVALRPDDGGSASEASVASMGTEGYASYGGDFTRTGVTSLLLGSGTELLRIAFERPVEVSGTRVEGGMDFGVALGGLDACDLQLAFSEERAEAAALAERALDGERKSDLGTALGAWTELLDRFPFERKLVQQATEARARLIQNGLAQVDELRREMERARFFLLPELFEKGAERAQELVRRYQGSEVEGEAKKVVEQCRMALVELSAGNRSDETRRLQGVLEALDPAASPQLAEHVREALGTMDRAMDQTMDQGTKGDLGAKGD